MGVGDFIVIAILAVIIFFCIRNIHRSVKRGGCCGDCSACGGSCHSHSAEKKKKS